MVCLHQNMPQSLQKPGQSLSWIVPTEIFWIVEIWSGKVKWLQISGATLWGIVQSFQEESSLGDSKINL